MRETFQLFLKGTGTSAFVVRKHLFLTHVYAAYGVVIPLKAAITGVVCQHSCLCHLGICHIEC
jgi:cytochrome b subunit of formate dehydrogenase